MKRVYVAGPYSAKDTISMLKNIRKGIRMGAELLLLGFAPFIPWLDYNVFLQLKEDEEVTVERIREYSMCWLRASDVVLVLKGWENSVGTLDEIDEAETHNIPVLFSKEDLVKYFKETL